MTLVELAKEIERLPVQQKLEVIKLVADMLQKDRDNFTDMLLASQSSIGFWNNSIDDEVWNNA